MLDERWGDAGPGRSLDIVLGRVGRKTERCEDGGADVVVCTRERLPVGPLVHHKTDGGGYDEVGLILFAAGKDGLEFVVEGTPLGGVGHADLEYAAEFRVALGLQPFLLRELFRRDGEMDLDRRLVAVDGTEAVGAA